MRSSPWRRRGAAAWPRGRGRIGRRRGWCSGWKRCIRGRRGGRCARPYCHTHPSPRAQPHTASQSLSQTHTLAHPRAHSPPHTQHHTQLHTPTHTPAPTPPTQVLAVLGRACAHWGGELSVRRLESGFGELISARKVTRLLYSTTILLYHGSELSLRRLESGFGELISARKVATAFFSSILPSRLLIRSPSRTFALPSYRPIALFTLLPSRPLALLH